ncbi:MAG TPA: diaminopimelate decarboxylase [Polyangiaceae bacterium]|nr:diaminopimelate decarboxylase [Polyangiaceae bacterium]
MFTRDATGAALLGGARLADLFDAGALSTPAYVYDLDAIEDGARALQAGFGAQRHLVAYAVKANSAGPIVKALARLGVGVDAVSGAELALALGAGAPPDRIVMSGVAKTDAEIDAAIGVGGRGILSIHAESTEELPRIAARARALGRTARVSLRVNPGIEADTHAYIATGHDEAKFGIPKAELGAAIETVLAAPELALVGVSSHIGSQLTATDEYATAARMLLDVVSAADAALAGAGRPALELVDFGGGFGIDYGDGCEASPADFAARAADLVRRAGRDHMLVVVEPGRSLVGAHGVLVASTIMQKRARPNDATRRWLMIDAGMNDLLRPALYKALHRIEGLESHDPHGEPTRVVGPVCESSDDFGTHAMAEPPPRRVVVRDAGAYGFTMASEYNGRALPIEVFLRRGAVAAVSTPRRADAWVRERLGDAE